MNPELLQKYDLPIPRYTSYPAVPYWNKETPAPESWAQAVRLAGEKKLSLYIHLPFCESLCTYCACNTRITVNHKVEEPYIARLLKEWSMYLELFPSTPQLSEVHLGGGTPTFFSAAHLTQLLKGIRETSLILPHATFSFEAHPANTTPEHLEALYAQGFRRISLGIQDFNEEVQRLIHRRQTVTQVKALTELARLIGYTSVNFDLIYGLPKQTPASISETIDKVIALRPDRIAFYSYAHVPWIHPGQRAYTEADLPQGKEKRDLYELGRAKLEEAGYIEIGLDHFALTGDELLQASRDGSLHRNFMGYTAQETSLLIGLGVSAISDAGSMLVQNEKTVEKWNAAIDQQVLPFFRGHPLSAEDQVLRRHILNIMCKGETSWYRMEEQCSSLEKAFQNLSGLHADGLVEVKAFSIRATPAGKAFLRNIGSCFDMYLQQPEPGKPIFSRSA